MPTRPPTPALPSLEATPEGGIKLDRHDTATLLLYIRDLERGY